MRRRAAGRVGRHVPNENGARASSGGRPGAVALRAAHVCPRARRQTFAPSATPRSKGADPSAEISSVDIKANAFSSRKRKNRRRRQRHLSGRRVNGLLGFFEANQRNTLECPGNDWSKKRIDRPLFRRRARRLSSCAFSRSLLYSCAGPRVRIPLSPALIQTDDERERKSEGK